MKGTSNMVAPVYGDQKNRGGRSQTEAPERPQILISSLLRNRRQREEGGGQSQPEEPRRPEEGEAQKEAPERSRSRLGLVFQ